MLAPVLMMLVAAPLSFESGTLTPPLVGAPSEAALRYATSRAGDLGLDSRTTLTPAGQFGTRFGGTVHLQQTLAGLPVVDRKVIVTFDLQQRVVRVSSSLKPIGAVALTETLTRDEAMVRAAKEIPGAWLRPDGTPWGATKRQLFPVGADLHVGYLVFVPTLKNSERWHVAIDAVTGDVLFTRNHAWSNQGAAVYASSPGGLNGGVGVTPTTQVTLQHLPADAGTLSGTLVTALNCCPTAGCVPDAGPARITGSFQTQQGPVPFDVAVCDQRQRASNDPAVHPSGDYVYTPVDPPQSATVTARNAADWDEFAEVNAYYHVNKAYDAVRAMSQGPLARDGGFSPFSMRDVGGLPTVWVNVFDADFNNAMPNAEGVYVSDTLARTDNAMFLGKENMDFVLLPEQVLPGDALVIYQGERADFAYDGPVLWHEFGHGVIYSTANWSRVVHFDARSGNDETSALHEGVADLIAAMTGQQSIVGEYVGPRIDPTTSAIRDVDNTFKCPDVLWGESHQDSMHFSGAVWEARKQFLGIDNGATFDAAFYAALVSFPPDVNFETAATLITAAVVQAFPNEADVQARLRALFTARGLINCSKLLDITDSLTTPRPYFGIPGATFAGVTTGATIPGPTQFVIRAPRGLKALRLSGLMQAFGANSRLELGASAGLPVGFTFANGTITNDAQFKVVPAVNQGDVTATLPVSVPCGGDLYVALSNTGRGDRALYNLAFSVDPADECPAVLDAGQPPAPDAGTVAPVDPVRLAGVPDPLGATVSGCTCNAVSPVGALLAAAVVLLRRRRR